MIPVSLEFDPSYFRDLLDPQAIRLMHRDVPVLLPSGPCHSVDHLYSLASRLAEVCSLFDAGTIPPITHRDIKQLLETSTEVAAPTRAMRSISSAASFVISSAFIPPDQLPLYTSSWLFTRDQVSEPPARLVAANFPSVLFSASMFASSTAAYAKHTIELYSEFVKEAGFDPTPDHLFAINSNRYINLSQQDPVHTVCYNRAISTARLVYPQSRPIREMSLPAMAVGAEIIDDQYKVYKFIPLITTGSVHHADQPPLHIELLIDDSNLSTSEIEQLCADSISYLLTRRKESVQNRGFMLVGVDPYPYQITRRNANFTGMRVQTHRSTYHSMSAEPTIATRYKSIQFTPNSHEFITLHSSMFHGVSCAQPYAMITFAYADKSEEQLPPDPELKLTKLSILPLLMNFRFEGQKLYAEPKPITYDQAIRMGLATKGYNEYSWRQKLQGMSNFVNRRSNGNARRDQYNLAIGPHTYLYTEIVEYARKYLGVDAPLPKSNKDSADLRAIYTYNPITGLLASDGKPVKITRAPSGFKVGEQYLGEILHNLLFGYDAVGTMTLRRICNEIAEAFVIPTGSILYSNSDLVTRVCSLSILTRHDSAPFVQTTKRVTSRVFGKDKVIRDPNDCDRSRVIFGPHLVFSNETEIHIFLNWVFKGFYIDNISLDTMSTNMVDSVYSEAYTTLARSLPNREAEGY